MKFGEFRLEEADGGILAHSLLIGNGKRLRKGQIIGENEVEQLRKAGRTSVVLAMPEPGDVLEDEAAQHIASQFLTKGFRADTAKTGRVNMFAETNGIFRVNTEVINRLNRIDQSVGFSTLPDFAEVNAGRMIATVKIIPYSVSSASLDQISNLDLKHAISVIPYRAKKIGLIFTETEGTKSRVNDKTRGVLERRLALSSSDIVQEQRVKHDVEDVTQALSNLDGDCDLIVLFGASAISDRKDVIPAAIEQASGEVIRFGMPVDPGNLLLLAKLDGKPVLGAPGCARSPAENGFDWVLQRMLADIPVTDDDISALGVGGLLMETGARPHPRDSKPNLKNKQAAIILAAGQSRRMGRENKMTVKVSGKPMVRHVVEAAQAAGLDELIVVTGHAPNEVHEVLEGCTVRYVHNAEYEEGLSSSLRSGVRAAYENGCNGALVLLGDMPFITREMIEKLIASSEAEPTMIHLSTAQGKRGNPVLWPASYFDELTQIKGDVGARHIIGENEDNVVEVELGEAAGIDLDTAEAIRRYEDAEPS